jgi:hypothetical protein
MSNEEPNLVIEIDYGDGITEQLTVTEGFTSFHPYPDNKKYTIDTTVIEDNSGGGDGGDVPTVTGINPSSLALTDPDTTVTVSGTNFDQDTVILWNGGEETTTFVSDTSVSTIVRPSTASSAVTVPVSVVGATTSVDFSFTDVEPGPTEDGPTAEIEIDDMTATAVVSYTPNTHVRFGWGDGQNGDATTDDQGEAVISHTYAEPGTYAAFVEDENGTPHNVGDITVPGDTQAWTADAAFDPAAHTVTEVIGYVEDNPDQREAILELEQEGKQRVTLINHLEGMA